jgi:FolB domain-containing protein
MIFIWLARQNGSGKKASFLLAIQRYCVSNGRLMQAPVTNSQASYNNVLRLNAVRLGVRLGCEKEERAQLQHVQVDVAFFAPALSAPAIEDKGDFICYDKVSQALEAMCKDKEFRLIEYLCKEMYDKVRHMTPEEVKISLRVTKCQIPVPFVLGGASFAYTDLPPFSWTPPLL